MKKGVHPELYPTIYVDVSSGREFFSTSTLKTRETRTIDGVSYYVSICDITADTHPVYTGKKGIVDTTGRVDRFNKRFTR